MRYTTIIDITEIPDVYRNSNVRLVYLHLVLKSGYHEDDLDKIKLSVRGIMYGTGLSLSAVRHALQVLEKNGLLEKRDNSTFIRKFLYQKAVKKRPKASEIDHGGNRVESSTAAVQEVGSELSDLEKWRRRRDSFIKYYQDLQEKAKNGDESARSAVARNKKLYESYINDKES